MIGYVDVSFIILVMYLVLSAITKIRIEKAKEVFYYQECEFNKDYKK